MLPEVVRVSERSLVVAEDVIGFEAAHSDFMQEEAGATVVYVGSVCACKAVRNG